MISHHQPPTLAIDFAALAAFLSSYTGYLPAIAIALPSIYYFLAICDLIRKWFKR